MVGKNSHYNYDDGIYMIYNILSIIRIELAS